MADAPDDTSTPDPTEGTPTADPTDPADTDWKAEAEKWKALSQKHEKNAKGNAAKARELETAQRAGMSELDRALAEARDAGFTDGRTKGLEREVAAELKAAAAGRPVDVDALLEAVDLTKFVTDDGEPDTAALASLVDRIAPASTETPGTAPLTPLDLGQGTPTSKVDTALDAFTRELAEKVGATPPTR